MVDVERVKWFEENYDMTREQAEQAAEVEEGGGDADLFPLGRDSVSEALVHPADLPPAST